MDPQHPRTFRNVGRKRTQLGNGNPHHCDKDAGLIRTVSSARITAQNVRRGSLNVTHQPHAGTFIPFVQMGRNPEGLRGKIPRFSTHGATWLCVQAFIPEAKCYKKMLQRPEPYFLLHLQIPHFQRLKVVRGAGFEPATPTVSR